MEELLSEVDRINKSKKTKRNQRELDEKWGQEVINKGWVAVPKILIQNQNKLKLTATELSVLLVLLSEWWDAKSRVIPSAKRIAEMTDKSERTVYKVIKELAEKDRGEYQKYLEQKGKKGLIEIKGRFDNMGKKTSNAYTFDGLYWLLNVIAAESNETLEDINLERAEIEKAVIALHRKS